MADGSAQGNGCDKHEVGLALIANSLRVTKRAAEMRAARERWPFTESPVRGGRRRSYPISQLPADVQTAVLVVRMPAEASLPALETREWSEEQQNSANARLVRTTDKHRAVALRRLQAIDSVETLVRHGHRRIPAREHVAAQLRRENFAGGTPASIARWEGQVHGAPRNVWQALLLPNYRGCTATAEIPVEAWDFFRSDWLRAAAPSAAAVYSRLQRVAVERGWILPSLDTFERRIKREIPRASRVLAREGEDALKRTFPAQERDKSMFNALDGVNADGHKVDVFVRWPTGDIVRPIILGVQDLGSGKLLGYRVAETESADLARLAFMDVVKQFGIPRQVWLDNGRAFASKLLTGGTTTRYRFKIREEDPTGILVSLGMKVHWTEPYAGQAKPIERAWRDIAERVAKHPAFHGAYTGNRPDAKPEDYGSHAVPYEQFMKVLAQEVIAHNAVTGRRNKICAGRSFDQVFNESYARTTIRRATAEQLRQMLLAAEVVYSSKSDGSVRLGGNRYWDAALVEHAGQRLTLRFDPQNLHGAVSAFTLAGVFVTDAPCVAAVGFADTDAGREHARARRQHSRAARDILKANQRMDAAQLAAQMPDLVAPELPNAPVVAPMFGKRRGHQVANAAEEGARATGTHGPAHPAQQKLDDLLERMGEARRRDPTFGMQMD